MEEILIIYGEYFFFLFLGYILLRGKKISFKLDYKLVFVGRGMKYIDRFFFLGRFIIFKFSISFVIRYIDRILFIVILVISVYRLDISVYSGYSVYSIYSV